jgi:hypothetical protein
MSIAKKKSMIANVRDPLMSLRKVAILVLAVPLSVMALVARADEAATRLESIQVATLPGKQVELRLITNAPPPSTDPPESPSTFRVSAWRSIDAKLMFDQVA